MNKSVVRYSEAFKQEVMRELESGVFENPAQASRRYGIKGGETVKRWAGQYGGNGMLTPSPLAHTSIRHAHTT